MKRRKVILGTLSLVVLSILMTGCLGGLFGPKVGIVTGEVKYEDGEAIEGAIVTIADKSGKTNASGAFSIANIKHGTHTLKVEVDGEQVHESKVAVGKTPLNRVITVSKKEGEVIGVVTRASGAAEAGATVKLAGQSAETDADGAYSFSNVKHGTHVVTVEIGGVQVYFDEVVLDDETVTYNIELPDVIEHGTVSGIVTDQDGVEVEGAIVSITGLSDETDAAGTYRIPNVLYGTHRITVEVNGKALYDEDVTVGADEVVHDIEVEIAGCEPLDGAVGVYCLEIAAGDTLDSLGWTVGAGDWKVVEAGGKYWIEGTNDKEGYAYVPVPEQANANRVIVEFTGMYTSAANTWGLQFLADRPDQHHGTNIMVLSAWNGIYLRKYNANAPGDTKIQPPKVEQNEEVTVRIVYDYAGKTLNVLRNGTQASEFPVTLSGEWLFQGPDHTLLKLFVNAVDKVGPTTARWTDIRIWVE